jgi:hypothetical protein
MSIEAMKQVLEALELHAKQYPHMQKGYTVDAITSLRQAIADLEKQEPVAWMYDWTRHDGEFIQDWTTSDAETLRDTEPTIISNVRPLYLHPDTTQRCYCGDIYRLNVVHREHTFCDEHPQENPQCPDCGAAAMYECVVCGSNNYPENFVKAKTTEFPVPLAWCRWSEDMQKWLYTSRQPTEELAWIPLYPHTHPQPKREPLTDEQILRLLSKIDECAVRLPRGLREFARAIEAAHGITSDMRQEHVDKTAKQRHEWVGLTPKERLVIINQWHWDEGKTDYLCRLIEEKLKEKNT